MCRLWRLEQKGVGFDCEAKKYYSCCGFMHYKRATFFIFLLNILWLICMIISIALGFRPETFILVMIALQALCLIFLWMGLRAHDGGGLLVFMGFQLYFAFYWFFQAIRFFVIVISLDEFTIFDHKFNIGYRDWIWDKLNDLGENEKNEVKVSIFAAIFSVLSQAFATIYCISAYVVYRCHLYFADLHAAKEYQKRREIFKDLRQDTIGTQDWIRIIVK
ncbi:unnamed protein product, partial [Mesorhabditis belari]|uniref:Uncharacterized protein n=1 Tax=Mesorhabditis belari TaxID=2138241 RepID=A0AAF3EXI1_9BILA